MTPAENNIELPMKEEKICLQGIEICILIDNQTKSKQRYRDDGLAIRLKLKNTTLDIVQEMRP